MVKQTYKDKLLDPRWQKKRLEILSRDKFTCQYCGDKTSSLHIHHYAYNKNGNPWDVENHCLNTLCDFCHLLEESFFKSEQDFNRISTIKQRFNGFYSASVLCYKNDYFVFIIFKYQNGKITHEGMLDVDMFLRMNSSYNEWEKLVINHHKPQQING